MLSLAWCVILLVLFAFHFNRGQYQSIFERKLATSFRCFETNSTKDHWRHSACDFKQSVPLCSSRLLDLGHSAPKHTLWLNLKSNLIFWSKNNYQNQPIQIFTWIVYKSIEYTWNCEWHCNLYIDCEIKYIEKKDIIWIDDIFCI